MGSVSPYFRRRRPQPQQEGNYLRDVGLRWIAGRLGLAPGKLGPLMAMFPPTPPGSVRAMVGNMLIRAGICPHVDLEHVHLAPYGEADPVAAARAGVDRRAAAAVFAGVAPHLGVLVAPRIAWQDGVPSPLDDATGATLDSPGDKLTSLRSLLEMKYYGRRAPTVYHPTTKSLAAMAYADYFPAGRGGALRAMVSGAIMASAPGWCGTYGPGMDPVSLAFGKLVEGNYDMAQQHLLHTAYAYFNELTGPARERLVTQLLARGCVHRISRPDSWTSGPLPQDWTGGGAVPALGVRVGETENHTLMIMTARYLANQLLYQRGSAARCDNRRNRVGKEPSCMEAVLYLLRNILLDDFSEYNAKSYQHETRMALLNLYNFAYDHEVRLAARMVLDYISGHMAVSGNDCRRLVPFRRKNDGKNAAHTGAGRMTVGLIEWQRGADPMTEHMALQTGATRAYQVPSEPIRALAWSIASDGGNGLHELLGTYRMPAPLHDLFVTDLHRRCFQVLNRRSLDAVTVTGRNADNAETFAVSPSYLITAGGAPATFAIDPYVWGYLPPGQDQQRGVALPSSFMPTGQSAGNRPDDPARATVGHAADAANLIQVGRFAQHGPVSNYGVAPDFLCGQLQALPPWCLQAIDSNHRRGKFDFVNKRGPDGQPGFYLALLRDDDFVAIEAFDTWLHPELGFDEFRARVWARNHDLSAHGLVEYGELTYTTENGNVIRFELWHEHEDDEVPSHGALVHSITWSGNDPTDRLPDASTYRFLKGAVLNSSGDGHITLTNPFLGQVITLDMRDGRRPRRTAETGAVESAGAGEEVWADFDWRGRHESEGDFCRPYRTLASAVDGVAARGVINLVPGASAERGALSGGKRLRLHAPIGGVRIGGLA